MWEIHFQSACYDYTGFQDYIKNNFTGDYADYAVIKGYY